MADDYYVLNIVFQNHYKYDELAQRFPVPKFLIWAALYENGPVD